MKSTLDKFFSEERKRVFEPGPYITQRVMARLSEAVPSIWDVIPRAMRPVMAVSLILLFGVLTVQIIVPVEPSGPGPIMAVVGQDLSTTEYRLFVDPTAPSDGEFDLLGFTP